MTRTLKTLLALLALTAFGAARAAGYPERTITLVVTYPAGGSTDTVGRLIAERLGKELGQTVIVENKGGAGGTIGAGAAARSAPDGYTLMLAAGAHAVAETIILKRTYDLARDFAPVALVARSGYLLVVNPAMPVNSAAELIALAKSKPGKLNYASTGNGSTPQLAAELFSSLSGAKLTEIPYKGDSPAIADLIGGQVDVAFMGISSAWPQVAGGKLKALAVSTKTRFSGDPQLPTVEEAGVKGYEFSTWWGVVAPAATPAAVIDKLSQALAKIVASPELKKRFFDLGIDAEYMGPAEFGPFIKGSIQQYASIAKGAGIKPQ
jgi:tripartite-type tricarboxylate transporter receptor subunit TctC